MSNLLYHGSDGGIVGNLSTKVGVESKDFGKGFYTCTDLNQAENRVSNKKESIVYAFTYDFSNCRVYSFDDIVLWALYVGYNRQIINIDSEDILNLFSRINSYDILIGYIADDKISAVYSDFLNGNITDVCLAECLKLVKYGKQIVFKTSSSLKCLKLYDKYVVTNDMKKVSKQWGANIRDNMDKCLEDYKVKFRRDGKYIDELIGVYRK